MVNSCEEQELRYFAAEKMNGNNEDRGPKSGDQKVRVGFSILCCYMGESWRV